MKSLSYLVLCLMACATLLPACRKDKTDTRNNTGPVISYCDTAHCEGHMECRDGVCQCSAYTGYEGADCNTPTREKFIGEYDGDETCEVGSSSYHISVTGGYNMAYVTVTNIYHEGYSVTALCDGRNLKLQEYVSDPNGTGDALILSGSGVLSTDRHTLSLTYRIENHTTGETHSCQWVGHKP